MQGTTLRVDARAAERHDRLSDVDHADHHRTRATQWPQAKGARRGVATPAIPGPDPLRSGHQPARAVRCDIYDHLVNRRLGAATPRPAMRRRPLDKWGCSTAWPRLNSGAITKQQFLDLNQKIGGYDNNGNYVATRTVGDLNAIRIAYETGRITNGGKGLSRHTPMSPDYRGYVDQPENGGEVHCALPFVLDARAAGPGERQPRQPGDADRRRPGAHVDRPVRRREPGAEPRADGRWTNGSRR